MFASSYIYPFILSWLQSVELRRRVHSGHGFEFVDVPLGSVLNSGVL
jgi:hypothetical protein